MGRLDNIIKRNQPGGRPRERTVVSLTVGFIVLLILFLAVFTDLGRAKPDRPPHDPTRVDGVYLGK